MIHSLKRAFILDHKVKENAELFLPLVNAVLSELQWHGQVRSGYRPKVVNKKIGGSPNSYHIYGRAIDIVDNDGRLKALMLKNTDLLKKYNLWMEHQDATKTWLHLDNGVRREREPRIFKPESMVAK